MGSCTHFSPSTPELISPGQNSVKIADDIFKCDFDNGNWLISQISSFYGVIDVE